MVLGAIFPKVFPGFSPLETRSLAAYGQRFNHSNKFKEAYLGKFEIEIEHILEHESGVHMGLIHEKNKSQKSRAIVPLMQLVS